MKKKQLKGCHTPEYSCPVPMPDCAPAKQEKIPSEKLLDLFEKEFCLACGTQLCHAVRDEEMREGCRKYRELILHEKQENVYAEVNNSKKLLCSDCGFCYDVDKHEHMIFNFCPNCGKKQPWKEYIDEVNT